MSEFKEDEKVHTACEYGSKEQTKLEAQKGKTGETLVLNSDMLMVTLILHLSAPVDRS
jgi:hypothetical protein